MPTTRRPRAQAQLATQGAPVTLFSAQRELEEGLFLRGNDLVCRTRQAERVLLHRADLPLPGRHNMENILASLAVALAAGVAPETARTTIRDFRGLEHRLEFVAEVGGVRYFNDSKATNVAAAQVSIEAFPSGLHVILGGLDKNSDFAPLVDALAPRAVSVALIGAAAEKLPPPLPDGCTNPSRAMPVWKRPFTVWPGVPGPATWFCLRRPVPVSICLITSSTGDGFSRQQSRG